MNNTDKQRNVAVLIDYENTGLEPIRSILEQVSSEGRIIIKRAYTDWSTQSAKRSMLSELGIEAVHHFRQTRGRKNASDICLAVEAVELAYSSPVDLFVIVSSDSDFIPLFNKLRTLGKTVIGVGRRSVVSGGLVSSCDKFIDIDSHGSPAAKPGPKKPETSAPSPTVNWEQKVDERWTSRAKDSIPGPQAANDAAKALGAPNLKASKYHSLQRLLDGSKLLSQKWRRDGNVIVKR